MALAEFLAELEDLLNSAKTAFDEAADAAALEAARIKFLGAKSGWLKSIQKNLGSIEENDKPEAGKRFNVVKEEIHVRFSSAQQRRQPVPPPQVMVVQPDMIHQFPGSEGQVTWIGGHATPHVQYQPPIGGGPGAGGTAPHNVLYELSMKGGVAAKGTAIVDLTLPGCVDESKTGTTARKKLRLGHLHPITQTIDDLKEIMGRLGFSVAEGPEIEDEWHNFEALNIPREHPARDPLENFYLATAGAIAGTATDDSPLLLRSQTSTVQIRVMERTRPPVRIISLGRVYRPDPADATHYPMFHQIEGLLVDHQVTMADLKSVLRLFAMSYFGGEVHIRFRPSFFPFTEPSVEVDMQWHDRWIEMGGAGMVDPNVLRAVGYDPEQVTGFAFGLGVERVCARRHQVTDIREFYKNDVRFLQQF